MSISTLVSGGVTSTSASRRAVPCISAARMTNEESTCKRTTDDRDAENGGHDREKRREAPATHHRMLHCGLMAGGPRGWLGSLVLTAINPAYLLTRRHLPRQARCTLDEAA